MTPIRPRSAVAPRPVADQPPGLKISLVQVIATALAAITATVVASFLGVAGTVVGAAVASTLSVVGTAVYSHSLRRTHARVRAVVPARRPAVAYRPVPRAGRPATGTAGPWAEPTYYPARQAVASSPRRRSLGTRLAIGSAALFAAVLAVVTGVEAVANRPISDLVRGESGSGTTLFGGAHTSSSGRSSATPSPGRSTRGPRSGRPTVTRTVTRTAEPSPTRSTPAPTSSSSTPSASPSPSPSGTATPGALGGVSAQP